MKNDTVSAQLSAFLDQKIKAQHPVAIGDMLNAFGSQSFGFLLLIFSLICAVLLLPGIHMFLAMPLFYLSIYQIMGKTEVWFPAKIRDYSLPAEAFKDLSDKTLRWVDKIEDYTEQRLLWLCEGSGYRITGIFVFYITFVMAVPLPLTNFIPALAIALIAIGLIMRDGLAILIGITGGVLWSFFLFFTYFAMVYIIYEKAIDFFAGA